jgi:hypothetical protein
MPENYPNCKKYCENDEESIAGLMKVYSETEVFSKSTLFQNKLRRPSLYDIFREVMQDGVFVLIPTSNAIGLVLRHGLTKRPTLNELVELLKPQA